MTLKRIRWILILTCGLILIGVGTILFGDWEQQPMYKGRSLSSWLSVYYVDQGNVSSAEVEAADAAVLHIGTNALPHLLKWIQGELPAWRRPLSRVMPARVWNNETFQHWLEGRAGRRQIYGAIGFGILGTNAISVLPELERLMKDNSKPHTAYAALSVVYGMGKPALPLLERCLLNTNQTNRAEFVTCVWEMAVRDGPADYLPLLHQTLTNDDVQVREIATNALQDISKKQPTR